MREFPGWMKLDEGSRDGAEVKRKKIHKEGREHSIALQVNNMAPIRGI